MYIFKLKRGNKMFSNVIGRYNNGNYKVVILEDGTKIRIQEDDNADFIPSFSESMDITITQKCDGKCPYCYAECTPQGEHADLFKYNFINSLHPYTEVALNGNDLSHPQLIDFLKFLKEKKVITNITVNQRHFMEHLGLLLDWQKMGWIHGIGISYVTPDFSFAHFLEKSYKNVVIHTIAGLLKEKDINFLSTLNRPILILGYKYKGRGKSYLQEDKNFKEIPNQIKWLENNLDMIFEKFPVVTFDNLAIDQLKVKSKLTKEQWEQYYMGDEGSSTFYIDMVHETFARSSMDTKEFSIEIATSHDNVDWMFNFIRNKYNGKIDGENKL